MRKHSTPLSGQKRWLCVGASSRAWRRDPRPPPRATLVAAIGAHAFELLAHRWVERQLTTAVTALLAVADPAPAVAVTRTRTAKVSSLTAST